MASQTVADYLLSRLRQCIIREGVKTKAQEFLPHNSQE
jgi:hypothetical protein